MLVWRQVPGPARKRRATMAPDERAAGQWLRAGILSPAEQVQAARPAGSPAANLITRWQLAEDGFPAGLREGGLGAGGDPDPVAVEDHVQGDHCAQSGGGDGRTKPGAAATPGSATPATAQQRPMPGQARKARAVRNSSLLKHLRPHKLSTAGSSRTWTYAWMTAWLASRAPVSTVSSLGGIWAWPSAHADIICAS